MQRLVFGLYSVIIITCCCASAFLPHENFRKSVAFAFKLPISNFRSPGLPGAGSYFIFNSKSPVQVSFSTSSSTTRLLQHSTRKAQSSGSSLGHPPVAAAAVPRTLFEAFHVFFGNIYHGPRTIAICIAGLLIGRGMLHTTLTLMEVGVAISVVVFWCFQEHVLHQRLLHSNSNWLGKRIHQQHHDKEYFHVSIDPAFLMISWLSIAGIILFCLLPTTEVAMTATIAYASAGLWYEWTHFIVHTRVRFPKHTYFDTCKTHHARHHLVSSDHWFAFSYPPVDDWWGTRPSSVEAVRNMKNKLRSDCEVG